MYNYEVFLRWEAGAPFDVEIGDDDLVGHGVQRVLANTAPEYTDTGDFTLGMSFIPSVQISITHLRYYHNAGCDAVSDHVLQLWHNDGTEVATVTDSHTSDPGNGWREIALTTPYEPDPDVEYVVSYRNESATNQIRSVTDPGLPGSVGYGVVNDKALYSAGVGFPTVQVDANYHADIVYVLPEVLAVGNEDEGTAADRFATGTRWTNTDDDEQWINYGTYDHPSWQEGIGPQGEQGNDGPTGADGAGMSIIPGGYHPETDTGFWGSGSGIGFGQNGAYNGQPHPPLGGAVDIYGDGGVVVPLLALVGPGILTLRSYGPNTAHLTLDGRDFGPVLIGSGAGPFDDLGLYHLEIPAGWHEVTIDQTLHTGASSGYAFDGGYWTPAHIEPLVAGYHAEDDPWWGAALDSRTFIQNGFFSNATDGLSDFYNDGVTVINKGFFGPGLLTLRSFGIGTAHLVVDGVDLGAVLTGGGGSGGTSLVGEYELVIPFGYHSVVIDQTLTVAVSNWNFDGGTWTPATVAAFVEPTTATPQAIAEALIAAGLMEAS